VALVRAEKPVNAASGSNSSQCPRCRSDLRSPGWGREYACPACGQPLSPTARPLAGRRRPAALTFCGVAIVLGLLALAKPSLFSTRAFGAVVIELGGGGRGMPGATPSPVRLPPRFRERLQRKVRLLQEDLSRSPDHPDLLRHLVRCYLSLALLSRKEDPPSSRMLLRRAAEYLAALRAVEPGLAERVQPVVDNFGSARWVDPSEFTGGGPLVGGIAGTPSSPPISPPPTLARPSPRDDPGQPPGLLTPSSAVQGPQVGQAQATPTVGPPSAPGPAPGLPAARSKEPSTVIRLNAGPRAGVVRRRKERLDSDIRWLKARFEKEPSASLVAFQLGLNLEERFQLDRPPPPPPTPGAEIPRRQPQDGPLLREALRVYQVAAENAKLRIHRATFLVKAGDIYARMGRYEDQYRMLRAALDASPTSSNVWQELASVCVLLGRLREGEEARAEGRAWAFPVVRPS
jgi:tetratricopeptide (TPR) repeat protein